MKAHLKKFNGGLVIRVTEMGKGKRDEIAKQIKQYLIDKKCEKPTVTTFDDPPPSCAPDEPNC